MPRYFPLLLIGTAAALLSACADTPEPAKVPVAYSTPVPRPLTPSDSLCPRDGLWRACHLEDRISKAGMMIKVLDTVRVVHVNMPGIRYKIGKNAKLVAYFFPDSLAGAAATASLDQLRLTPPRDSIGQWPTAPFEAIRSANMIAVLFEVTAAQAERVRLAITAGAPQKFSESAPTPQVLPPATAR